MSPAVLLSLYCVPIMLASLAGGWLPSLIKMTHLRRQLIMSLVSGVMLGVALLHMLVHAVELTAIRWVGGAMLCGILTMFFLLRVFHVHSHGPDERDDANDDDHDHVCDHVGERHRLSWGGLFLGLAIHSLLDGVALGASVVAESGHEHAVGTVAGLGTFFAVFLHKPLDALSITSLMHAENWSATHRHVVNGAFALICPCGAFSFWLGASQIAHGQQTLVGCALAFSAGFFLCIALSDLLPEVMFHTHDRAKLAMALLIGVAVAIAIELTHSHVNHGEKKDHQDHHHHGHSHHGHKH